MSVLGNLVVGTFFALVPGQSLEPGKTVERWGKLELVFQSAQDYENPLYEVDVFRVGFRSPTGRIWKIDGFWDGARCWKARFQPDEIGQWNYQSECSNKSDQGLHGREGVFLVRQNSNDHAIYSRGPVIRPAGRYYLVHSDGTPFFWTADTAWNGALKSTNEEWRFYLEDRVNKGFNVIQFVTTQWRGCDADRNGDVAFSGSGRIQVNPHFFHRLDEKIDLINEYGMVAAPVLLWTLQWGQGRHLSPGYYLPEDEAVMLARYLVARYGGNHVAWILGGDGRYVDEYEQRWKNIGRRVFIDDPPGIVAQHPHGKSWIGSAYRDEFWLDVIGYQSSHSKKEETVNWINEGPVSKEWDKLPPKPIINLEPIYEEIHADVTVKDVRNACYWSVFAAPPAGITYGANGIWPWLREGEKILNHADASWTSDWRRSVSLPGSEQVGGLSRFIQQFEWWTLRPAHRELLIKQPGDELFNRFVPILRTDDYRTILAYIPTPTPITIRNPLRSGYSVTWFHPAKNRIISDQSISPEASLTFVPPEPENEDIVLILRSQSAPGN